MGLKRNAEDLIQTLNPVSFPNDEIQSNDWTVYKCLLIWKILDEDLKKSG